MLRAREREEGPKCCCSLFAAQASSRARQAKLDLPLLCLAFPFPARQCSHTLLREHTHAHPQRTLFRGIFHHLSNTFSSKKNHHKTKFSTRKKVSVTDSRIVNRKEHNPFLTGYPNLTLKFKLSANLIIFEKTRSVQNAPNI